MIVSAVMDHMPDILEAVEQRTNLGPRDVSWYRLTKFTSSTGPGVAEILRVVAELTSNGDVGYNIFVTLDFCLPILDALTRAVLDDEINHHINSLFLSIEVVHGDIVDDKHGDDIDENAPTNRAIAKIEEARTEIEKATFSEDSMRDDQIREALHEALNLAESLAYSGSGSIYDEEQAEEKGLFSRMFRPVLSIMSSDIYGGVRGGVIGCLAVHFTEIFGSAASDITCALAAGASGTANAIVKSTESGVRMAWDNVRRRILAGEELE